MQKPNNLMFPGRWESSFPLSKLCTWRIGGEADQVYWPADAAALKAFLDWSLQHERTVYILGRGSNVLMPDHGFAGTMVVLTDLREVFWEIDADAVGCVKVGGGYSLMRLAREAARRGLGGLEFAWGIPGTVGAAVAINAGAHGSDMSRVVKKVKVLGQENSVYVWQEIDASGITFAYRNSSLRQEKKIIVEVEIALTPELDPARIRSRGEEVMARRRMTQPLEFPNAGSVFRNPPGDSAGRLIEAAGWKGRSYGGAEVSEKHANFIINRQAAKATDVQKLIRDIQQDVLQKFGVALQAEVVMVGPGCPDKDD